MHGSLVYDLLDSTPTRFPSLFQASYAIKLKKHIIDQQAATIEHLTLKNDQLLNEIRSTAREGIRIEYPGQDRHDQLEIEDVLQHSSVASQLQQRILQLEAELDERNASITEMAELITTRETGQMALFQAVKDFITQEAGVLPHHQTDHFTPTKSTAYSSPGLEPDRMLYWQQRLVEKAAESTKRLRGELSWAADTPGNHKQQKSEEKEEEHNGDGIAMHLPTSSSSMEIDNTALDDDNTVLTESPLFDIVPMHQRGELLEYNKEDEEDE
jgi:hypothetical protein